MDKEKINKGCGKRFRDGFKDASNCGINEELCIDCEILLDKTIENEN